MDNYYNPDMCTEDTLALNWANFAQLMVGQSLLGAITPRMIAIDVRTRFERSVDLDFYVDFDSREDAVVINDVVTDLDACFAHLPFPIAINAQVVVDPDFIPTPAMRLSYLRLRGPKSRKD